jgi:CRISPR-associated endonuclease Cas2
LNALLSLSYTLLMHELTGLLEGAGLDPYLGFLHQPDRGRPSLALDLMEPFRHPLADRLVLTLVNRAIIQEGDFHRVEDRAGVFLQPQPLKKFFAEYERWLLEKPLERPPDGGASGLRWRELLKCEVEKLAGALGGGTVRSVSLADARHWDGREGPMQYVVCYDIADDARRSRVSNCLLDFGTRVQESVFVANLEEAHAERMERRLERLVHPDLDRLHIFELCAACGRKTKVLGAGETVVDREFYVI